MFLQRILYVASEVAPFLETSLVAGCMRTLPEVMQHKQIDVRIMVPKFGIINDRINKLHEVLRLSGNIISINKIKYAIIVKVSTIPNTRLQVYFIDNQNLFGNRKAVFTDKHNNFFEDNDLRMTFFCLSVMETLKKLEWAPDIVHCHGWITSLFPLFGKKLDQYLPLFTKTKFITTLYNDTFTGDFVLLKDIIKNTGIAPTDIPWLTRGSFRDIIELATYYSDLIICGETFNTAEFKNLFENQKPLSIQNNTTDYEQYWSLYNKIITP